MNYTQIIFEKAERIAFITLNRPERLNAFTQTMGQEIRQALMEVEEDPEMRVTIMTGAGRGFCAGADLQRGGDTFDRTKRPPEERRASLLKYYFSLKKPVIVAYNGPSVGVGVTMTLPYDIPYRSRERPSGNRFQPSGNHPGGGLCLASSEDRRNQPGG